MKKRIMAIIGIVLPILCYIPLLAVKEPDEIWSFVPIIVAVGEEPYKGAILNQIWIQILITLCILLSYQLFYFGTSLINGIKEKIKTLTVFSVIGLIFTVLFFTSFLASDFSTNDTLGYGFMLIMNIPYLIIFSIVMLILSFKKTKIKNDA